MDGSPRKPHNPLPWAGRRVTLMGLGRHGGGLGAARFLARSGARLTISDQASSESLCDVLSDLDGLPIHRFRFGGHRPRDFTTADVLVVNPAVRPDHPLIAQVRRHGATVTSEIELFLGLSPARVIAITGSNGKSTTATMLRDILAAAGRRVWLGGNIGGSLLDDLHRIAADDWVVLELSSFQLAHLSDATRWPDLAVVTNCTPNHLDWHGTFDHYAQAKRRLVEHAALAVLNPADPVSRAWQQDRRGSTCWSWPPDRVGPLAVPGAHNRGNAALAAAVAEQVGVDPHTIRQALAAFTGLEHRLQFIGQAADRRFYNDSKATSPAAAIAALTALDGPTWLVAGGVSKHVPLDDLAACVADRARGAALFGQSRHELAAALAAVAPRFPAHVCATLAEALAWCCEQSHPGDAILLSPACASFDQFRDFQARGAAFCTLVRRLAADQPRDAPARRDRHDSCTPRLARLG